MLTCLLRRAARRQGQRRVQDKGGGWRADGGSLRLLFNLIKCRDSTQRREGNSWTNLWQDAEGEPNVQLLWCRGCVEKGNQLCMSQLLCTAYCFHMLHHIL